MTPPFMFPPTAKVWLLVLRVHTAYTYNCIATVLSLRFDMDISAEGAREVYEYYEASGDRTYTMVVWSDREEIMIRHVTKEAEIRLKGYT